MNTLGSRMEAVFTESDMLDQDRIGWGNFMHRPLCKATGPVASGFKSRQLHVQLLLERVLQRASLKEID